MDKRSVGRGVPYRLDALERIIPQRLPPCSVAVASRIYGLYLKKTGLNPMGFIDTEFSFMFPVEQKPGEKYYTTKDFEPLEAAEELFYQTNKDKGVLYFQGLAAGYW